MFEARALNLYLRVSPMGFTCVADNAKPLLQLTNFPEDNRD